MRLRLDADLRHLFIFLGIFLILTLFNLFSLLMFTLDTKISLVTS